jgi:hypothetical protein
MRFPFKTILLCIAMLLFGVGSGIDSIAEVTNVAKLGYVYGPAIREAVEQKLLRLI